MNAANPLDRFGRAFGAAFDHVITPLLVGMALAIVTTGLFA